MEKLIQYLETHNLQIEDVLEELSSSLLLDIHILMRKYYFSISKVIYYQNESEICISDFIFNLSNLKFVYNEIHYHMNILYKGMLKSNIDLYNDEILGEDTYDDNMQKYRKSYLNDWSSLVKLIENDITVNKLKEYLQVLYF